MEVVINNIQYVPAPAKCENPALLDLRFQCGDLGREVSIREYFSELLTTLWLEEEGFSGKRPFGNSGWQYDLFRALVAAGAIDGKLDAEGYLDDYDRSAGHEVIKGIIAEMCKAKE